MQVIGAVGRNWVGGLNREAGLALRVALQVMLLPQHVPDPFQGRQFALRKQFIRQRQQPKK
jgi:hypothetical protein